MEALLFTTSAEIIKSIITSKIFNRISILAYSEEEVDLDMKLTSEIDEISTTSSRHIFGERIKQFNKSTRCLSFGCGYIFTTEDINHFKFPILNFHTGHIPLNRGRTPLFWDIIENAKYSYGTLHAITDQIDMGIILHQVKTTINAKDNPKTLANRLTELVLNDKSITKWLSSPIKNIHQKRFIQSKGKYKVAFKPDANYNSSEYNSEYLERLWRCYSIWGKIKINGTYFSNLTNIKKNINDLDIRSLDGNTLYGEKFA